MTRIALSTCWPSVPTAPLEAVRLGGSSTTPSRASHITDDEFRRCGSFFKPWCRAVEITRPRWTKRRCEDRKVGLQTAGGCRFSILAGARSLPGIKQRCGEVLLLVVMIIAVGMALIFLLL